MKSREIPRDEWIRFFNNLSLKQEGWEVTLEIFGPDIGDQVEESHMFLMGMTAELATDRKDRIAIMMGAKASGHVTHVITDPIRVDFQQTDLGIDSALRIQTGDGITSLLHLS